ncbi:BlaR1 family beta-lactam sensor/signal transducer [Salicibibacter cibarius]|uniref:BlaR1 family beta-lactam sensor/signal transducer n=2 Tax=Salicibibacter cibarius TaxID=2743000 RepID=A0A7T6Z7E2_9BACI|nr:BlaR1 family beta-lactam sensor/signal transducer [Salicibibacter cibarius]
MVLSIVFSTATIAMILLIRRFYGNKLTAKWKYYMWFFLLISLTIPLLPIQYIDWKHSVPQANNSIMNTSQHSETSTSVNNGNWMNDFSYSVNRLDFTILSEIIFYGWMIGMVFFGVFAILAQVRIHRIKNASTTIENQDVRRLFARCKKSLGITQDLVMKESSVVTSPTTFGFFKTYILLPNDLDKSFSMREIELILLHELHHYKSKHVHVNYIFLVYQIMYWFHPLVWWAFKEMKLDREIACDAAVLHTLDRQSYKDYGNTLINFAHRYARFSSFHLTNQFFGSKTHLKKRIINIADYNGDSLPKKRKGIITCIFLSIVITIQVPVTAVTAEPNDYYDFDDDQPVYEDFSDDFGGYDGSFVLYSMQNEQYHIHNEEKGTLRMSPNSTYKPFSALFALEQNVISIDHSTLNWNGQPYAYNEWNRDQDLPSAMQHSVTWYFQELDKQVNEENIQSFLEKVDYGNHDLSGGIEEYWLESSLEISLIEQVQLLQDVYTNQFEFEEEHIQFLKDVMILEENDSGTLYGKTGTGNINGKHRNGLFIGFVETSNDTFFFATNIEENDHATGSKAAEITLDILNQKNIYHHRKEGKQNDT